MTVEVDQLITSFLQFMGTQDCHSFIGRDALGNDVAVVWDDHSGWRTCTSDGQLGDRLNEADVARLWDASRTCV